MIRSLRKVIAPVESGVLNSRFSVPLRSSFPPPELAWQPLGIAYPLPCPGPPDVVPDIPDVTPRFCGTLSLADSVRVISFSTPLRPFRCISPRISIRACTFRGPEAYQALLTACRETLVTLHFDESYRGELGVCSSTFGLPSRLFISRFTRSRGPVGPLRQTGGGSCSSSKRRKPQSVPSQTLAIDSLPKILTNIFIFPSILPVGEPTRIYSEEKYDSDDEEDKTATRGSSDRILSCLAKQVSEVGGKLSLRSNIRSASATYRLISIFY